LENILFPNSLKLASNIFIYKTFGNNFIRSGGMEGSDDAKIPIPCTSDALLMHKSLEFKLKDVTLSLAPTVAL
jgi:hypothetical protein